MKKLVSVVLPCHNEEENISEIVPDIVKNIPSNYDYEIICVDDGSSDNTLKEIEKLSRKNNRVKGISFYRNFGHQQALRAGIEKAKGEIVITMDADFQHPPKLIPNLISLWEKGYDLVACQKKSDKNASTLINIQRKLGYYIWTKISDGVILPGVSDFRLMSKPIASYITDSNESEIFLRGQVQLAAKKPTTLAYDVDKRRYGKSSYSTKQFLNIFSLGLISFSIKPLRFAWLLGILISLSSVVYILADSIFALINHRQIIEGWRTVVALLLLLNGFIIFFLGILGEYLGIVFKESKRRPKYIIENTINISK